MTLAVECDVKQQINLNLKAIKRYLLFFSVVFRYGVELGALFLNELTSYLTECNQSKELVLLYLTFTNFCFVFPRFFLGPLLFSFHTKLLSLVIGKCKGVKFHFYADGTQVYVHLSQKNTSAAFKQLNRCLDHVKEWMSTCKLKPDKAEFTLFDSKGRGIN